MSDYRIEPEYIIVDGWVVCGPQPNQRQHAVRITMDDKGVEWVEFSCGASGASTRKKTRSPVSRRLSELHIVSRDDLIRDRPVCQQGWCQSRHKDFVQHSDEYKRRRAEEAVRIAEQMPVARRKLLDLERRLARL